MAKVYPLITLPSETGGGAYAVHCHCPVGGAVRQINGVDSSRVDYRESARIEVLLEDSGRSVLSGKRDWPVRRGTRDRSIHPRRSRESYAKRQWHVVGPNNVAVDVIDDQSHPVACGIHDNRGFVIVADRLRFYPVDEIGHLTHGYVQPVFAHGTGNFWSGHGDDRSNNQNHYRSLENRKPRFLPSRLGAHRSLQIRLVNIDLRPGINHA